MTRERILVVDDSPTILKLVQLALTKADYRVTTATTGDEALAAAREARPALILLDSSLPDQPDQHGLSLAVQLCDDAQLGSIPVVLMNTRPSDDDPRTVRPSNVVDAIRKPFSSEALLAVTGHVLARSGAGQDVPEPIAHERSSGSLADVLQATPPPSDSVLARVAASALSGDLRVVALADVLSLLASEGQTGELFVTRDRARLRLYLRKGRLEFANAEGIAEEFLLGRFLVKTGALDPDTLVAALEARQSLPPAEGETALFGAFLVARGLVAAEDLTRALGLQTSALVFEALRWGGGRFGFEPLSELPPAADQAALELQVPALLLEGFRRVDEWRLIEREIGDFDQIFVREEDRLLGLGRGRLTQDEHAVLELVDGRRSVRDLMDRSTLGAFDTAKMLYRLLKLRLIRRRLQPIAV